MSVKETDIGKMKFWVPRLWEQDWPAAIDNAEELEKELVEMQSETAQLLRRVADSEVTFGCLAWLNLWSKAFAILEASRCAARHKSLLILHMLTRTSLEQALHTQAIIAPFREFKAPSEETNSASRTGRIKNDIIKRLEAYAAWSIWNDQLYYQQFVAPETLDSLWEPDPAIAEIAVDPISREVYEALYGRLEIQDEKELRRGRSRQQEEGHSRLTRIDEWLKHPALKPWHEILKHKNKKYKPVTFFALLGETSAGVRRYLKHFDLLFAYPNYARASTVIHASSFDEFLHFGDNTIIPLFMDFHDQTSSKVNEISRYCNMIIVALSLLANSIWPAK